MKARRALALALQSIRRGRRAFFFSVFGITVGIAALAFFLALSKGVATRVVARVFPPGRLTVVPAQTSLGGDLVNSLLGGPRGLDDEAAAALRARPEVAAVYPRMRVEAPARAWGGEALLGRPLYFELIADGVDPAAVTEKTSPIEFWDHEEKPRDKRVGTFCTSDAQCQAPLYCAWDKNRCELPVPVIVSPLLIEIYNTSLAKSRGLPRIGNFLASQFRGFPFTAELGRSFVNRNLQVGAARQRRFVLVGISDHALSLGVTVPLGYARRWNQEYGSGPPRYSSLTVEVRPGASVTQVVQVVRGLGFALEDNGAEQAGLAVTLLTAVFLLVSLAILLVAAVNIAHTFLRAVSERRRELGVLRALGASAWDIQGLLLLEASIVGATGGVLGLLLALAAAAGVDLLSRRALPDFPFKPDSYFLFSPGLCALALGFSVLACLLGALGPARAAARLSPAQALTAL